MTPQAPGAALGIEDPNPRILTIELSLQILGKPNILKEVKSEAESVALEESPEPWGQTCSR